MCRGSVWNGDEAALGRGVRRLMYWFCGMGDRNGEEEDRKGCQGDGRVRG